jgi:hypothetical protein
VQLKETIQMQYTVDDAGINARRYDKVDVLALLDPLWLENTQAHQLARMVAEARDAGNFDDQSAIVATAAA